MAVLLENGTRKIAASDNENFLVVLFEFFDKGNEIAVAADNDEGIDMVAGESHLERVKRKVDVGAILVATRRQIPLHHLNSVLRHAPAVLAGTLPVAVGN